MTNQEIEQEIEKILELQNIFKLNSVQDVNHHPHPYTIGPKHVAYASDHHSGMLGEETLKKVPCAYSGCHLDYKDHKSEKVVFLSLLRNADSEEVRDTLVNIVTVGNGILAGVSFFETPEKFRILDTN